MKDNEEIHGPLKMPANYPQDWLESAMVITGAFEGTSFSTIAGNFDGMGVSGGVLQWNLGQGSLQRKILRPYADRYGVHKLDKWFPIPISHMMDADPAIGVEWAKHNMLDGTKLRPEWKLAWNVFLARNTVKELQLEAARALASEAWHDMIHHGLSSRRAFCWFFDVYVQNGGLKGIQMPQVDIATYMNLLDKDPGVSPQNRLTWMHAAVDDEGMILFIWSCLRANKNKWREDVISRKGTIAHMEGRVHNHDFNFEEILT